jgi:hypothetical protein
VKIRVIRGQNKTQFAGTANIVHPREKAHAMATGFLTSHLKLHTSAQRQAGLKALSYNLLWVTVVLVFQLILFFLAISVGVYT